MANPQPDKYIKISTELFEKLAAIRIPGEARQVLDVIIRKTWGFGKKSDYIPLSQFVSSTGLKKANVCRALSKLITMRLVIKNDNGQLQIQKDYEKWQPLGKKEIVIKNDNTIIKNDNKSLSKKSTSIDTTINTISINSGAASPENKKRENGLISVGSLLGNNPLRTRFQSEAIRFAENLNINLEDADKKLPSIRSRFFRLFKDAEVNRREGLLSTAYSYCFDNPTFKSLSPDKKILFFMWKFNNPNKEVGI